MKTVYLDTNILLTLLRHTEADYQDVIELAKQKHLNFVTGTISIIELSSVLSREFNILKKGLQDHETSVPFKELVQFPKDEQLIVIIRFLLEWFHTSILDDLSPEIGLSTHSFFKINPVFRLASRQSHITELRSLDSVHFATAKLYDDILGIRIHYLVTADGNFLAKRAECQSVSNILIVNPQTLIDLECA